MIRPGQGTGVQAGSTLAGGEASGGLFVTVANPFLNPGPQADEGVCASEMSVVLQFHVHKRTRLKIVQNIQSMREGGTAFLKKEGLSSIA